jgi:hypothetical protein
VSDNFDRGALLAAAPIQARWTDEPPILLATAPCIEPISRYVRFPLWEGL